MNSHHGESSPPRESDYLLMELIIRKYTSRIELAIPIVSHQSDDPQRFIGDYELVSASGRHAVLN